MKYYKESFNPYIIFLVVFLSLSRILFTPLFNEDYLVLSWLNPDNFCDAFRDFSTRTTGGPYWRPVVWSSYFVTKFFFAYNGFAYHLTNLLMYSILMSLLYKLLLNLKFRADISLIGILIFAFLPSHELIYSWIPARTDLMMVFFLMLAILSYQKAKASRKYYIASSLFYLLAVLSKEAAYPAVLLPILLAMLENPNERHWAIAVKAMMVAVLIIAFTLLYRYFIIGGTPFETSNYQSFGIGDVMKNILIYIPLSVSNADLLERTFFFIANNVWLLAIALVPFFFIFKEFELSKLKGKHSLILFGILWFLAFILPAAPTLMQWYVFVPSIGLFISFMIIASSLKHQRSFPILAFITLLVMISFSIIRTNDWVEVGIRTNEALAGIGKLASEKGQLQDTIIVLSAPNKINRINSMKIGIQQGIQHSTKNDRLTAIAPFRCEVELNSTINITRKDNTIELQLSRGRFVRSGGRSSTRIIDEEITINEDNIEIIINNRSNNTAYTRVILPPTNTFPVYYYNGKTFNLLK